MGAVEKILGRAGVIGAGIKRASARGMRVVKRQQEVEEGLCCLRASGSGNDSKGVGGRRSCRCYREDCWVGRSGMERVSKECQQEECVWRRGGRWLRRASAASERM